MNKDNSTSLLHAFKVIFTNPYVILFLIAVVLAVCFFVCKEPEKEVVVEEKIEETPNLIDQMKEIGEWEFYNIATEELVDTTCKKFLRKHQLTLIYKGTLRLGINFKEIKDDWFYAPNRDSVFCLLPPVKLLDEKFINETSTVVLHEDGTFDSNVRAEMTKRAYSQMKKKNLNKENMKRAQKSAEEGIRAYLENFGFKYIEILWKETYKQ